MEEQYDILWEGKSGREYGFYILPLDPEVRLIDEPGVFICARKLKSGIWEPLSIDRAGSLDAAMQEQSREACISQHHGTHLHVRPSESGSREEAELAADLREMWNPLCS